MDSLFNDLENGLRVSFDWFSFTVLEAPYCNDIIGALSLFGLLPSDFEIMPNGGKGYKSMMRLSGQQVYIYYNGSEDMGIHFEVRGSSIVNFLQYYSESISFDCPFGECRDIDISSSLMREFINTVLEHGKFSRIDLAVDNIGSIFYTPAEVNALHMQQCIVSRSRSFTYYEKTDSSSVVNGSTFYIGTRSSDIMLRVYDKQAEQNTKHPANPIISPWVRWELECKGKKVNAVAQNLASGKGLGTVAMGVLSNYIRIIDMDNNNRSRCSTSTKWDAFLCGIERLALTVPEAEKSLEKSETYLNKQYAPTIALLVMRDDGRYTSLMKIIDSGKKRLRPAQIQRLPREAQERYYSELNKEDCYDITGSF